MQSAPQKIAQKQEYNIRNISYLDFQLAI